MALCRSCQRDPDEWDREMRRLASEADYYKRIAQAYKDVAEGRLCPLTKAQEMATSASPAGHRQTHETRTVNN